MAGISRRQWLSAAVWAGGTGLALPELLRGRAQAASAGNAGVVPRSDTAVIQIWLGGGPSQFETFDPKPGAPIEVRGPYEAISSRLPGVLVSETLPRVATVLDRATIIRSITQATNSHFSGAHSCVTGYLGKIGGALYPSNGAVASRFCGPRRAGMPPYVLLSEEQTRNPDIGSIMGPGHLGSAQAPMTVLQNPFVHDFRQAPLDAATADFMLADDLTFARLGDRKSLLGELDRLPRRLDATRRMDGIDQFQRAALEMVTSAKAREAFDLSREAPSTRARYGTHRWGQAALLSRRLVEAGVTFVTLNTAPDSLCWDWHRNVVDDARPADGSDGPSRGMRHSGPPLDQALSALIGDLSERGLDRKVLVVVWGEFGRTPRLNATGGRDHWGPVMSILLAGGGLKMGQVIGATNANGEVPTERPVSPNDVLTMMYRHLGIDPALQTQNQVGRPIPLLPDGQPIAELL